MNFVQFSLGFFAVAVSCLAPTFGKRRNIQVQVERNTDNIRYILRETLALRDDIEVVHGILNKTCAVDEEVVSETKESNTESGHDDIKSDLLTKVDLQMKYVLNGVKDAKYDAHESFNQIKEDQIYVINKTEHIENNIKDLQVQFLALHSTAQNQTDQTKSELTHITDAIVNETHEISQDLHNLDSSMNSLKSRFESFEEKSKTLYLDTQSLKDEVNELQVKDASTEDSVKVVQEELADLKTKMNLVFVRLELMEWKYFHGSYYKFFKRKVDFGTANTICENQNSYLASITSQEENTFVAGMLAVSSPSHTWLGGNDKDSEGQWKWASNEYFLYNRWSSGEPNDESSGEDCISMYTNGKWNDLPCTFQANFVCEMRV